MRTLTFTLGFADGSFLAGPPDSRGYARESFREARWRGQRWTRQTCPAGDRRPTALAAISGGVRLPTDLPAPLDPQRMRLAPRAGALEFLCSSSCERAGAPARRFRCRVVSVRPG